MQRLRLIPRFAVWLTELLTLLFAVGFIIFGFQMFFGSEDPDEFMNGFLILPIGLVLAYLFTMVVVFVSYLLNFLTKFDDFDGFFDILSSLRLAPLYLIKHVFVHVVAIFRLLFTGDID